MRCFWAGPTWRSHFILSLKYQVIIYFCCNTSNILKMLLNSSSVDIWNVKKGRLSCFPGDIPWSDSTSGSHPQWRLWGIPDSSMVVRKIEVTVIHEHKRTDLERTLIPPQFRDSWIALRRNSQSYSPGAPEFRIGNIHFYTEQRVFVFLSRMQSPNAGSRAAF